MCLLIEYGAIAQLGERSNRTAEVEGSNPSGSTMNQNFFPQHFIFPGAVAPKS